MKFIHLSDLHLGKRIKEISLIEDQSHILNEILKVIDNEKPDVVLIAGDVYDKQIPPVEAVNLFDNFLNQLTERKLNVFIISGNHDSAERLTFGSKLMQSSGVYFSKSYKGKCESVTLNDENGPVNFYLLPFVKPVFVKQYFPDEKIETYTDALDVVIKNIHLNKDERNVLISHQFVTGAQRSESEEVSVGGLDNVDSFVFEDFDYVALGHIHGPQKIGSEKIRYCGTPLKYSFSEVSHQKGVAVVTLGKKGEFEYKNVPLVPLRDMREIKGSYDEITYKKNYENTNLQDFIHITLTDQEEKAEAFFKLQSIYPNLLSLDYDNLRSKTNNKISKSENVKLLSPLQVFSKLYEIQNNQPMEKEQESYMQKLIEKIWEAE